jgi:opacity protein-like surface antigen
MRSICRVTLLALALGASAVHADGLLYLGAGVSQNKLDDIGNSFSHLDNTSWKVLLGTRPIKLLGLEGDYLDLGSHSDQFINGAGSVHSDAKAFAAYLVGYLPLPVPFLDVYGKAGLARWQLHQDTYSSSLPPGSFFHLSNNGTDFAWGVGAQVHLGNIGARLEYERFNIANTNGAQVFSLDAVLSLL